MFAYIMGNVSYASADEIVLENNKIGYRIKVPLSTSSKLKEGDEDVKLYTYLSVKDDGLELYGFLTENEFKMFKLLIAVSKVGPKSASAILSSAKVSEIARAVIDNDSALLSKTPGIGKKTAERIVLELGGKVSDFSIAPDKDGNFGNAEFFDALSVLGYKEGEIRKVSSEIDFNEGALEDWIKSALKLLYKRT